MSNRLARLRLKPPNNRRVSKPGFDVSVKSTVKSVLCHCA
jgi:hypothetical protein